MKRALLVSPYFIPCNLAGVHRVRLLAKGLPTFGWKPTVLAVHPRYYGSSFEPGLTDLVPEDLRVEHVDAISDELSARARIGDLSLRAYWAMRRRMRELLAAGEVDLVFVSVLPGYAGMLGGWAKRRFAVPFVLDYQDPWVSEWGATQSLFSKAGVAHRLATILEPRFAPLADAITAVSERTLDGLRARGSLLSRTQTRSIPIGSDPNDQAVARKRGQSHIEKIQGVFDFAFVGTLAERMFPSMVATLRALQRHAENRGDLRFRLHLIGTSGHANGERPDRIGELIAEHARGGFVQYQPNRIPYLDALRTMQMADALLLLGSTDAHYTASKIFPSWLTMRPIIGFAHRQSSVHDIAAKIGGIQVIGYDGQPEGRAEAEFLNLVDAVMQRGEAAVPPRNEMAFEPYSPAGIGHAYADLFDKIVGRRH